MKKHGLAPSWKNKEKKQAKIISINDKLRKMRDILNNECFYLQEAVLQIIIKEGLVSEEILYQ